MTDASAQARESAESLSVEDYEEMMGTLDLLLDEALGKVESGRVYDAENERVRIKWIRIAKDVVAEKRKVAVERDLEELAEKIEDLQEQQETTR